MELLDFNFEQRIERAETLPARCYTDARYLEAEQRRLFNRSWQLIGRLDQARQPGDFFTADAGEEPVVVVRGLDGALRGFHNVCPHRAGPVAAGAGHCEKLRCGYHGWTYALDGRLIGVPDFEGVECFNQEAFGLRPVELAVWEQFLFARVDRRNGIGLPEFLGDIPELTRHCGIAEMKFAARRDYVLDCNWKVYVDNYVEGYHVPIIHPSLMRELDYSRYRTLTRRYHSQQDAPIKAGNAPDRQYQPTAAQRDALYFWVFPNLMLNVYPDNISTNLILPLGKDRTLIIFEWFFQEIESREARARIERVVALSDEVQQEDIAICEAVQKRLRSVACERGRYSAKRENGVHHFHALWMEFMQAV